MLKSIFLHNNYFSIIQGDSPIVSRYYSIKMPLTFGSVGDIISVGQTAWKLIQALTDVKGSAAQYQGLIKELRAFERAMLQVSSQHVFRELVGMAHASVR